MDIPELKPAHCQHPVIGRLIINTVDGQGFPDQAIAFDIRHEVKSNVEEKAVHFEIDELTAFHISDRFYHSHHIYPVEVPEDQQQQLAGDEASGD